MLNESNRELLVKSIAKITLKWIVTKIPFLSGGFFSYIILSILEKIIWFVIYNTPIRTILFKEIQEIKLEEKEYVEAFWEIQSLPEDTPDEIRKFKNDEFEKIAKKFLTV